MRKILLLLTCLLAVPIAACHTVGAVATGGPAVVADQTKLDEQVGLSLTLASTAASRAAALAITAGVITDRATIAKIGQLDSRAYAVVQAVRSAYLAGNGTNYLAAIEAARKAVNDLLVSVGGKAVSLVLPPGGADTYAQAGLAHARTASATGLAS